MAEFVFNIAKGRPVEWTINPGANGAFILVLLQDTGLEADATLIDYDTLGAILAASNTEADFTNYTRKTLTLGSTVDDANDRADLDVADVTYTAAGGATDNTVVKGIICYDPDTTSGTDANIIPLSGHDVTFVTDGTDITVSATTGGVFLRASG